MNQKFCQSCGMPLNSEADFGTNTDDTLNFDYCTYCFQEGKFTKECTMGEMIEHCLQYLGEFNKDSKQQFTIDEARVEMTKYFPTLKRWAKA